MIADLIGRWAEVQPDKLALDYNADPWTYRVLAERIAAARGHFRALGLAGEGVVALAMGSIRDVWVASLALRSLGLTTIDLQQASALATLPLPHIRCVIAAAGESWPGLEAACAARDTPLVRLSAHAAPPLAIGLDPPARPGGHILQTSGTTGDLKYVLFDPSFELAYQAQRRASNGVDANVVLNVFDLAGWTGGGYKSPVSAWIAGGSVVIHQGPDPQAALRRPGVNFSVLVPSMLRMILAAPPKEVPWLPHMRLSVTGGALSLAEIEETRARITPHIENGLGATECLCIAYTPLRTADDHRWQTPAPNTLVQVVGDDGRPVAAGEIGRLRVTTENAPQGYLNDEATTRAFFQDGFFYPGDLAVTRGDGRFALMGRVTEVINVAGHKISPQPIEERLRDVLGVTGVCLATRPNAAGDESLHAVIEAAAPVDPRRLADAFRAEFSAFPGVSVHYTAALPRNEMGKVLRRAVAERLAAEPI